MITPADLHDCIATTHTIDCREVLAENRGVGWSRCLPGRKEGRNSDCNRFLENVSGPLSTGCCSLSFVPDRTYSVNGKLVSFSRVRRGGLTVCDGPSFWLAHGI